jgi:hypothetical protein
MMCNRALLAHVMLVCYATSMYWCCFVLVAIQLRMWQLSSCAMGVCAHATCDMAPSSPHVVSIINFCDTAWTQLLPCTNDLHRLSNTCAAVLYSLCSTQNKL